MKNSSSIRRTNLSGSLYRLIYRSRHVIPPSTPDQDGEHAIRTILATARRRNKADGITGALLFTASGFAQVLEGPRDTLERTFERISADPRHTDVMVLSFTPTERRCFPDWSMGFCAHTAPLSADPLAPPQAAAPLDTAFDPPRATTGTEMLRLLEKVVQRDDVWVAA